MSFKSFARTTAPLRFTSKRTTPSASFNIATDLQPGDRIEYWCVFHNRWKPGVFTRYGDRRQYTWDTPEHVWAHWEGGQSETYVTTDYRIRLAEE